MQQPELGRKIAELRKAKMLTQEELVEMCNISVRTIQRIEAGEVTPRDYTVRTILGALEYKTEQVVINDPYKDINTADPISKFFLNGVSITQSYAIRNLNTAFVFGVVYFILRFVEAAAEFSRFMEDDAFNDLAYTIIKLALIFSAICFFRGFAIIGALFENNLLKLMSSILIVANVVIVGLDLLSVYYFNFDPEVIIFLYSITFGVSGIIFGYALTKLEGSLGRVSKLAGALEIVTGLFSLTVIFAIIGQFIIIPAELLEIMLIYRAMGILKLDPSRHGKN